MKISVSHYSKKKFDLLSIIPFRIDSGKRENGYQLDKY